jgi:uncharacterized protein (TIGR03435 family)
MYEFSAKIPEGVATDQIPLMLQGMLRDRFGLKMHWESKEQAVYALVATKAVPKLKPSAPDAPGGARFSSLGHFELNRTTMPAFAQSLSGMLGRPVLDTTGIERFYDFVFDVNPADLAGRLYESPASVESKNPSIFAVLQEMGFKLESRKAAINHLVIDHVEKVPTEN